VAVLIALVASMATLLWALNASSFFQVIVYATLIQLMAMAIVGVSAIVVPWRRPELYRASASQKSFLGLPLVSVAGAVAVCACVFIWVMYFSYRTEFGLQNLGRLFAIFGGTIALAVVYYLVASAVRRSQGVDLTRTYAEIPPE
jgi:amino acid transporter